MTAHGRALFISCPISTLDRESIVMALPSASRAPEQQDATIPTGTSRFEHDLSWSKWRTLLVIQG